MKEYIVDMRDLAPGEHEECPDSFADHPGKTQMENMLIDHFGKKIRIKVTEVREP